MAAGAVDSVSFSVKRGEGCLEYGAIVLREGWITVQLVPLQLWRRPRPLLQHLPSSPSLTPL